MNKLEIMGQKTLDALLRAMIGHKPGITSEGLWKTAKDWDHKLTSFEFDHGLSLLHGAFRVTNKQWYPVGHVAAPKRSTGRDPDPRQVPFAF